MRKTKDIFLSLSPVLYLLCFIFLFRQIFTTDPLYGSHQLSLILAGAVAIWQRRNIHHAKQAFLLAWKKNFLSVWPAMEILLLVGILIGSWADAGVLFSMIQLGVRVLSPEFFLPGVCLISGIASLISGSSWTTAGTLGVALMGVGQVLGVDESICAGAIVSGCYFGDKLSPLSDTTNLASSLTGVPILDHIFHMAKTTIPSFFAALALFYGANLFVVVGGTTSHTTDLGFLGFGSEADGFINPSLIPIMLVFGASLFRVPPRYSLLLGIFSANWISFSLGHNIGSVLTSLSFGFASKTGNESLDILLGGGGVIAVFPTECLILSAVWFGGALEGLGYLQELLHYLRNWIRKKADVLLATMGTSFLLNLTTADQYLSLVIPARAYRNLADHYELPSKDVSRALEDSGTISSPLIPWNSCGAFMATSLKVSTFSYLPFVWFNIIHITFAIFTAFWNRKKEK
ncbi:Na+/H+ antiporter NhaC family protein [Leptospira ilyithenensis]|uniref:Na+/H+ antiporter NhaC family protein n=1 Tax=Leptospira ilyithenensis TaxID=2484901 RepID=UPI001AEF8F28|nr:Na+/H+ antiporter NhaC family protein [Leptospira ilyithenensis]